VKVPSACSQRNDTQTRRACASAFALASFRDARCAASVTSVARSGSLVSSNRRAPHSVAATAPLNKKLYDE